MNQYFSRRFRIDRQTILGHGLLALCLWALLIWTSSPASARTQRTASPPNGAEIERASSLPAYVILGHKRRLQELRVGDDAWTLGADGFVISWTRWNDVWHPSAVQNIPRAQTLFFDRGEVLIYTEDEDLWRASSSTGAWEKTDDTSPAQHNAGEHHESVRCYVADTYAPCALLDQQNSPKSAMVSAPKLRDILIAEHGYYFVFRDGWYAYDAQGLVTPKDPRAVRKLSDKEQRVWVKGDVIASGVHAGDAHVALCVEAGDGTTVIDRNLRSGDAVVILESERPCPNRADYTPQFLRLSYADHSVRWTLNTQEIQEAPVSITLDNALAVELRASASVSRGCAHHTWDVSLYSDIVAEALLRRGLCAASATALDWNALDGRSGGSGILFVGSFGSFALMVDAKTMQIHTLQTNLRIATHARIRRTSDGSWLIADDKTSTVLRINSSGELGESNDLILIGNRLWYQAEGGVLTSDDGHQLLATDAGVVLNGVGIGPVAWRTLTADMRRVRQHSTLFSEQVNALRAGVSHAN